MTEQNQAPQVQQEDINVLPAPANPIYKMSLDEKLKYAASIGLPATGIFELMHGGGAGFVLGLIAACGAGFFSEEIKDMKEKFLPKRSTSRKSSKFTDANWWLGQTGDDKATHLLPETQQVMQQETIEGVFPRYPENETLRLGRVLATGQRFDPHFNEVVGKGFIATSVQGSGKSQLCGLIIEQSGKCGVPAMVLDHKGEYKAIKELSFTNVYIAGAESSDGRDFILTKDNALELVELMMIHRYQVVVDLPSYGIDSWINKAEIVAAIGHALMTYAGKQRQLKQVILPCLVLLDEAQLYLPQDQTLLPPEATENKGILSDLKNAYFALVSNGRSNGYTMFFATQALTYIAKWAIKSCQIQSYGRQTEKNALDMCEKIIESTIATREDLYRLSPGVGVVYGFTQDPMIIQFDKKQSRDESETPKIERLRKPVQPVSDMSSVKLAVPQGQQITLSYADLIAIMNTQNAVSSGLSNVSNYVTQNNAGNSMETMQETRLQANPDKIITHVFPVSNQEQETVSLSVDFEKEVPEWKRKQIQAMKEANYTDRDIASLVKLTGRKYKLYQECLIRLGYKQQEAK